MELAVFAIVMVVMFAAKVASVMLTRDALVEKSVAFSWTDPQKGAELPELGAEAPAASAEGASWHTGYGRLPRIA